jgi:hypothetical protein
MEEIEVACSLEAMSWGLLRWWVSKDDILVMEVGEMCFGFLKG